MGQVTTNNNNFAVASWGVADEHRQLGFTGLNTGVVTSWDENQQNELAPLYNEVGSKIGETIYDKTFSVTCTIQVKLTAQSPKAGEGISVRSADGKTRYYFVQGCRLSEQNRDYRKFTLTLNSSYYATGAQFQSKADGIVE